MASRSRISPVHRSHSSLRLALVSMPWALFNRPSIQLGGLKAYLAADRDWLTVDTMHPYLEVADKIGTDLYHWISQESWVGEACYSALLFPEQKEDAARMAVARHRRKPRRSRGPDFDFNQTLAILEQQLTAWLARQDWSRYQLVGFSVCFNQLLASLTAAAGIKRTHPDLMVVLGGSICAGSLGSSLLTFPQVDYVVPGEGEIPLRELCRFLAGKRATLPETLNSRVRPAAKARAPSPQLKDLNRLPVPDYQDYFAELQQWFASRPFIPVLPLEFSRGCWWGKCAFCNLNLQWQGYRRKKAARVLQEVSTLAERYQVLDFTFTDNALPPAEAVRFFGQLAKQRPDYRFFGEIRATTGPKELAVFRSGGLTTVQVGIESLSNSLLARLNKGVTVLDNIVVLKNGMEQDIVLEGNLITEFPGSTPAEVAETLANLDFVLPFRPLTIAVFFLGHGSPVQQSPKKFHIRAMVTDPRNKALFPGELLAGLTLLIKGYRGDRKMQRRLWRPVADKVGLWQRFHARRADTGRSPGALSYRDGAGFLIIRQELPDQPTLHHRLQGTSRAIYLACNQPCSILELEQRFPRIRRQPLLAFVNDLVNKRLMFTENKKYLSLAIHNKTNRGR
ncbi:MAG: RiPP maturation radical SAM C-methyltransferase [Desulfobacterales bacterium]|nr:RiPP maturation radical SAM C-methyltransferase [Desulfobacterales bacterium]